MVATQEEQEASTPMSRFIIAKLGKVYRRFERLEVIPADSTNIIDEVDLNDMVKETIEEVYASITGTSPKSFPTREMAQENLVYHVQKMPFFDPEPEQPAVDPVAPADRKKKAPKVKETYTLSTSFEPVVLAKLAPQACECVSILMELAAETGGFRFSEDAVAKKFEGCKERLKTVQPPWRILQYYRTKLVAAGILMVA